MPETPPGTPPGTAPGTPDGWQDILAPGERILWQGRPQARPDWAALISGKGGVTGSLFGLFFAGFALFWIVQAASMTARAEGPLARLFPLFGLPFLVVGLNLVLGPALRPWAGLRGTWYTLTDRNAYIATRRLGRRNLQRHPLAPGMLPALEDGSPGSVWFATMPGPGGGAWRGTGAAGAYGGSGGRVGFQNIPDARAVFRLLTAALEALPRHHTPPPLAAHPVDSGPADRL